MHFFLSLHPLRIHSTTWKLWRPSKYPLANTLALGAPLFLENSWHSYHSEATQQFTIFPNLPTSSLRYLFTIFPLPSGCEPGHRYLHLRAQGHRLGWPEQDRRGYRLRKAALQQATQGGRRRRSGGEEWKQCKVEITYEFVVWLSIVRLLRCNANM